MDTQRFDHLSAPLTTSGTRRQAIRSLAGVAAALAVAGIIGGDEGEAKKRKKGKGRKGSKGNASNGANSGGQDSGGSTGGNTGGDGSSNGGGNTGGGGSTTQSEEAILLGLINNFRAQNGVPALGRNGKLDSAAQSHSQDQANRLFSSHNSPEGVTPDQRLLAAGYSYSWWGENIYMSAPGDGSAQSAFTWWKNSSGHRANMLSTNFTQIGIGRATGSNGRTYWTNAFGKPA